MNVAAGRAGRGARRGVGLRAGAGWWGGGGMGEEGGEKRKMTIKELADANTKKGLKSSSGGTYGFASPAKALIEPKGKYLEDGWVDDGDGAGEGRGFFEGLAKLFSGKKDE